MSTAESGHVDGWVARRRRISRHLERTALQLFADRGYLEVTLQEVAAAAGVSPRTLTRYFPLKEDLLLSQPRRSAEAAIAALSLAPSGRDAVASLWDTWVDLSARSEPTDLADLALWYRAAQTAPRALAHGGAEMSELVSGHLTRIAAQSLGVGPDDLPAKVLAGALSAALEAVLQHWLDRDGQVDLAQLFVQARHALEHGFTA